MLMPLRRSVHALRVTAARAMSNTVDASAAVTTVADTFPFKLHRSNAQELIAKVPVIEVNKSVAMCDGGGGATGHPIEFIQLDLQAGAKPNTCKYCGLRYKMKK